MAEPEPEHGRTSDGQREQAPPDRRTPGKSL